MVWTHGCPDGEAVAQVSERADRAVALALEHMETRDVVFVGHGHFSRSVITRWVELPHRPRASGSAMAPGLDRGVRLRTRRPPDQRARAPGHCNP